MSCDNLLYSLPCILTALTIQTAVDFFLSNLSQNIIFLYKQMLHGITFYGKTLRKTNENNT